MHVVNILKRASLLVLPAIFLICAASVESKADAVGVCNADGPGQCSVTVNITGNVVTITVTNTTPAVNSGFVTAVAFNLAAGTVVNNFSTTNANFALFGPAPTGWDGSVNPDGARTHLVGLANQYEGGGAPGGGIPSGGGVATFTLTLASLNGNTESAILNSMLVRERGFEPDGSDKDALTVTQVPEPASMLLLGTGLIGVAAGFRRRFKK